MTRCETSRLGAIPCLVSYLPPNVARQRQNVRRDLKKKMAEESTAVKLALESHNLFIFVLCCTEKVFQLQ